MSLASTKQITLALGLALAGIAAHAALPDAITLDKGVEASVTAFNPLGSRLVIWLPADAGDAGADARAAERFAKHDVEVWLVDLLEARFLPQLPSSLAQIPDSDVVAVLDAAHGYAPHKPLYLLAAGRGAGPLLRGAHAWQARGNETALKGGILLWPNLHVTTPEVGQEAQYLPVVAQTHLPLVIVQPALSPWHWWVDRLVQTLERGGSRVTVQTLAGVRDRFYFRSNENDAERAATQRFGDILFEALKAVPSQSRR